MRRPKLAHLFIICIFISSSMVWLSTHHNFSYSDLPLSLKSIIARKDKLINLATGFCASQRYKDILKPCQGRSNYSQEWRTLTNHSLVKFHLQKNGGVKSSPLRIEIQTFDLNLKPKTIGGDYWFGYLKTKNIRYTLRFIDHGDGGYVAYFKPPIAAGYTLYLTLEHTLCRGLLDPPLNWTNSRNWSSTRRCSNQKAKKRIDGRFSD